mmetsp:Transcript_89160/g.199375  ORF Transcript_89160/g.199375 Transcript_89160/m.199375 type:complete len:293 (+) Transcript_89160:198-1076(+)
MPSSPWPSGVKSCRTVRWYPARSRTVLSAPATARGLGGSPSSAAATSCLPAASVGVKASLGAKASLGTRPSGICGPVCCCRACWPKPGCASVKGATATTRERTWFGWPMTLTLLSSLYKTTRASPLGCFQTIAPSGSRVDFPMCWSIFSQNWSRSPQKRRSTVSSCPARSGTITTFVALSLTAAPPSLPPAVRTFTLPVRVLLGGIGWLPWKAGTVHSVSCTSPSCRMLPILIHSAMSSSAFLQSHSTLVLPSLLKVNRSTPTGSSGRRSGARSGSGETRSQSGMRTLDLPA